MIRQKVINMDENTEIKTTEVKKTTTLGMEENIEGALCYVFGFVTGIIFLILEKDNKFVKFHATQSTITFLALTVFWWIISSIGFWSWSLMWLFGMVSALIGLLELILWVVLILKAYQKETFKLPIVGDIAAKQAGI